MTTMTQAIQFEVEALKTQAQLYRHKVIERIADKPETVLIEAENVERYNRLIRGCDDLLIACKGSEQGEGVLSGCALYVLIIKRINPSQNRHHEDNCSRLWRALQLAEERYHENNDYRFEKSKLDEIAAGACL